MGRRIAVVIDGKEQILAGEVASNEGNTGTNQDHAAQDGNQSKGLTAAIIALTNEYRARDQENQRQQKKNNRWVKTGTIFVALYTAITFCQWLLTRQILSHTVSMARLDQRAWMGVASVKADPPFPKEGNHNGFV
jgi:hypothetical protein